MSELAGQHLGQYQIIEQIGMGGMATVYKAYQASMDRFVAVKVLPKQLADDPTFYARFEQEARTIARLENKNILPVYDYGEHNGYTYLVMRYVGEGTLQHLINQGPLSLDDAGRYLSQVAEALHYAHEHGVVHRDVKSSNVLMGEKGQCYLTDFGIAKLTAGSSQLTGTGVVVGTPAYMSPEQCSGLPADSRSDIYSLGVVLYEMLTGRVPFQAETPLAVVLMHVQQPLPSPRSLMPVIPETVEQVIFKVLAKDPDQRYQTAKAFADAYQEALEVFKSQDTLMLSGSAVRRAAGFSEAPTQHDLAAAPISSTATAQRAPTTPLVAPRKGGFKWWWTAVPLIVIALALAAVVALSGGADEDKPAPTGQTPQADQSAVPPAETPGAADATPAALPVANETEPAWQTFTDITGYNDLHRQIVVTDSGVWMITDGGLTRWQRDGSAHTFTSADGLPFNDLHTLALDTQGHLWLGGGGNHHEVVRVPITPDGIGTIDTFNRFTANLSGDYAWALLPEPDGHLLVGTYESRIEYWDGQGWQTPPFPTDDPDLIAVGDQVWALARTPDGSLWAGGPAGLAVLPPGSDDWQAIPAPADLSDQPPDVVYFYNFYVDPTDGSLWLNLGTQPDSGMHVRQLIPPADAAGDWTWAAPPDWLPDGTRRILRAADGSLWALNYGVVMRVSSDGARRDLFGVEQGLAGESYFDIAEDTDGTIWVTSDTALIHYDGRRWTPYLNPNDLPINDVRQMVEAPDGTLWFIGDYGPLFTYYDGMFEMIDYIDGNLYDLALQGDVVWLANEYGLVRWEKGSQRLYTTEDGLSANRVLDVEIDPHTPELLWLGTQDGLTAFNTADGTAQTWFYANGDLPGQVVQTLAFDAQGVLWIGVGMDYQVPDSGQAALLTWQDSVLAVVASVGDPFDAEYDDIVLAVAFDASGNLWVGTEDSLYQRKGERWKRATEAEAGPEGKSIAAILPDGDSVLVLTNYYGLYRYREGTGWRPYGFVKTGEAYQNSLYRTSDGALWILTDSGITRVVGDLDAVH
jgi:ligand-binding sensor domain-containing protein/tRNA A-37 threonylcarbamoyl transferase component Bud32